MTKFKWLVLAIAALFFMTGQPGFADDRGKLLGIWRLAAFEVEYQATSAREYPRGKNPTGFITFTPEGRMTVLLTDEGRKAPKTDQDRSDLFASMVAYTGMYRIEGEKWMAKVDVSANPALVGTEQTRSFRIDGDRLQEITQWTARGEKGMGRAVITWERTK